MLADFQFCISVPLKLAGKTQLLKFKGNSNETITLRRTWNKRPISISSDGDIGELHPDFIFQSNTDFFEMPLYFFSLD